MSLAKTAQALRVRLDNVVLRRLDGTLRLVKVVNQWIIFRIKTAFTMPKTFP